MTRPEASEDSTAELDVLLGASARYALGPIDGAAFVGWFADVLPILCPDFVSAFAHDEQSRRSAFRSLGRLLWNRMPLPDNGFRPRPLPKPERNAPCLCGSGRKYKHCCAHAESLPDPFAELSLLKYVLAQYPRTQLRSLPLAGLDLEELAYIGGEWRREGRTADAEALLEHVFEDIDRLDARAQFAFDVLADCYDELHRPKKKERLIERVAHARDRTLRSAALHRRITMLADRGERAEAWRLFAEAQRLEPDNPMLATLELTMLLGQGDYDRMRDRGQYWIARLARDRNYDHTDLIAHLRERKRRGSTAKGASSCGRRAARSPGRAACAPASLRSMPILVLLAPEDLEIRRIAVYAPRRPPKSHRRGFDPAAPPASRFLDDDPLMQERHPMDG